MISAARVEQTRRTFDAALDEIEKKIPRRHYLVGEQFTCADLSVASMLPFSVMPAEHPFPWQEYHDLQTKYFCDDYQDHPVSE